LKELAKRSLVALWGVPIILGLSYLGGYFFLAFILAINGVALWEFYTMFQNQGIRPYQRIGTLLSALLVAAAYYLSFADLAFVLLPMVIIILIFHLRLSQPNSSTNSVFTLGGIFYITLFLITVLKLRQGFAGWSGAAGDAYAGGRLLVLIWISIWICDTFAYFGGKTFGKHKLAPNTSPNKTVEGGFSGLLGAFLIFLGLGPFLLPHLPAIYLWAGGFIVGVFGQVGDLVESRFKRDAGVKDTSHILPGHGGFLDRFDSFIFVSPFFYFLFYFFRHTMN